MSFQQCGQRPQSASPLRALRTLVDGERWYAVHTLPQRESYAEGHLQNQGFDTFLPKRRQTVRHARKSRVVAGSFFPRYLFIILDLTRDRWRSVNGTFGVSRLVMRGDDPHPVPPGVVEALMASVGEDGMIQLGQLLKPGDVVRIMAGPFADQLAFLDQLDDIGRVRVLLDILGRQVVVSTTTNNLLPIPNSR